MNIARIARLLAGFVLFFSLVQVVPLVLALLEAPGKFDARAGFAGSMVIGAAVAGLLWLSGLGASDEFRRREALAVVAFSWLLAGVLGGLPFIWSGALSGVDAVFESVSGLTTTGASVFGASVTPAVEDLPPSILFWRSLLHFVGGLGIVLVFIILLPAMGVTGKNLLSSEQTGVTTDLSEPRMVDQSRALFRCYLFLTVACLLSFWLAGMGWFDAICHGFSTTATGGFSTRNLSLAAYQNPAIEMVAALFMFLAGCNFAWFVALVREPGDARSLLRTPELRCYVGIVGASILITTLSLWLSGAKLPDIEGSRDYASFARCLRDATCNVVSMFTSTGFASADFQNWPRLALAVMVLGMLFGSCTGSTAGGLKMLRITVCAKLIAYHVRRFVRPKTVERLKLGGEVIADPVVSSVLAIAVLWIALIGLGAMVFALDGRLDLQSCVTASASLMGNSGPALTPVLQQGDALILANPGKLNLGPYGSFGDVLGVVKVWGSFQMLLGRLEILTLLVLLSPGFWRR